MTAESAAGPNIRITLPTLHPTQRNIARSPARFKVVNCGRRWGKTALGIVLCLAGNEADPRQRGALRGGRIWWIGPTYKQAQEGWTYLLALVRQMPATMVTVSHTELKVSFAGGGSVQVRTEGGDPDNLRGAGLDGVVCDEYALFNPDSWSQVLRPALADKQGWAMFISSPQHFNHFWELYEMAEAGADDWACWTHPTWDNPYIAASEIEAARRDMLDEDFEQEFGASFTAVGGAVFRLLSSDRPIYLRTMPAGLDVRRTGVGLDWGTTPGHEAAVVSGSLMSTGAVWVRSAWLDHSGSSDLWRAEAVRCSRDYGATFARVDRSQSSELDRIKSAGFWDAASGNAHVEVRLAEFQSLVIKRAIFFDLAGPGVQAYYDHLCAYHRDREGKIVEEQDDDVDAGCYLVSELVRPTAEFAPPVARPVFRTDPHPVPYRGANVRNKVRGGAA